jgi:hypothetical protein
MIEALNGIRCDVCKKEHHYAPGVIVSGFRALPDGWYMLFRGKYDPNQDWPVFCSKECLLASLGEVKP